MLILMYSIMKRIEKIGRRHLMIITQMAITAIIINLI